MVLAGWLLVTPSAAQESASTETVEAGCSAWNPVSTRSKMRTTRCARSSEVEGKSGMTVVKPRDVSRFCNSAASCKCKEISAIKPTSGSELTTASTCGAPA
jgi:hypothetical protein